MTTSTRLNEILEDLNNFPRSWKCHWNPRSVWDMIPDLPEFSRDTYSVNPYNRKDLVVLVDGEVISRPEASAPWSLATVTYADLAAEQWAMRGFEWEAAEPWDAAQFDPDEAKERRDAGLSVEEAIKWRDHEQNRTQSDLAVDQLAELKAAGITPDWSSREISIIQDLNVNPDYLAGAADSDPAFYGVVAEWNAADLTTEEIEDYIDAEVLYPHIAVALKAAGVTPLGAACEHAYGRTLGDLCSNSEMDVATAAIWAEAEVSRSYIEAWSEYHDEHRRWRDPFEAAEIVAFWNADINPRFSDQQMSIINRLSAGREVLESKLDHTPAFYEAVMEWDDEYGCVPTWLNEYVDRGVFAVANAETLADAGLTWADDGGDPEMGFRFAKGDITLEQLRPALIERMSK